MITFPTTPNGPILVEEEVVWLGSAYFVIDGRVFPRNMNTFWLTVRGRADAEGPVCLDAKRALLQTVEAAWPHFQKTCRAA